MRRLRSVLREIAILAGEDYDTAMTADDPAAIAVAAVTMLRDDFVATLEGMQVVPESLPEARRHLRLAAPAGESSRPGR